MRPENSILKEMLRLPTSGARTVERFVVDGESYLAIPQLAYDIPQTEPNLYTWRENKEWYVVVSNRLSADLRFRTDTLIYRFLP